MKPVILVVDDEPGITSALSLVLSDEGYDVLTASDGAQAVAMLTRRHVDLIISDVMMPAVDGLTLVRHLRRRGDRTPIIFMTAGIELIQPLSDVAIIGKPFDLDALLALVERTLASSKDPLREQPLPKEQSNESSGKW